MSITLAYNNHIQCQLVMLITYWYFQFSTADQVAYSGFRTNQRRGCNKPGKIFNSR